MFGQGGVTILSSATGISRSTIYLGLEDIKSKKIIDPDKIRRSGGSGSNSKKSRLWKAELQRLADKIGLNIHVSHFPPGTSKWNKIEHKMFSYISMNWRGRPLTTYNVIVNLIGNTKNKAGLEIRAKLDNRKYEKEIKVTDEEFNSISLIMLTDS